MTRQLTDGELEAYLDETMTAEEMAAVERALREQPSLLERLASINSRRDAGVHSIGEIWRRHRVSCPSREQLGSYLLGVLDDDSMRYIEFHIQRVGCGLCRANLEDLRRQQQETSAEVATRRSRYLQSSAGYLRREK